MYSRLNDEDILNQGREKLNMDIRTILKILISFIVAENILVPSYCQNFIISVENADLESPSSTWNEYEVKEIKELQEKEKTISVATVLDNEYVFDVRKPSKVSSKK